MQKILKENYANSMGGSETSFRDRPINIDETGNRKWIRAKQPQGKWYTWRSLVAYLLLSFLVLAPLLRINGNPLMLFDIGHRQFYIFGISFWAQDTNILALIMAVVVVSIVLFTVVYGRIWCGWACPQTLFMEMVFRRIEYLFDGNYRKGNRKPSKGVKKFIKHLVFFLTAILITNVFLMWFIGPQGLLDLITSPIRDNWLGFLIMLGLSIFYFFIYAFFREQVCTMICPYGRMQGVLLDSRSNTVIYDYKRGEPRGAKTEGDCINCNQCVHVCPTGIDIKNGTQLECINCAACIDECNLVMKRIKKPENLIRFDSAVGIEQGKKVLGNARTYAYTTVLLILFGVLVASVIRRTDVESSILRVPGTMYQEVDSEIFSNMYRVKIINKTKSDKNLDIRLLSPEYGTIQLANPESQLPGNGALESILIIKLNKKLLEGKSTALKIGIFEGENLLETKNINFIGPAK